MQCFHDDDELTASKAIAGVRRVEIKASSSSTHEQNDMSANRSRMDEIAARGASEQLPTRFVLMAPIYTSLNARDIHVRIGVVPIDEKPAFRLRIMREDAIRQEVSKEVELELRHAWQDVHVFIGNVNRGR